MLEALIRFSLTQRLFVAFLVVVVAALGLRAWLNLPIDAFPDIAPTQVKIILKAPGMTAEEIELQVTRRIETELLGIPRQEMLRSTTKYAITDITLDFKNGTDIYWARQQVSERLASIRDSLPQGITGGIAAMSTPLSEMFMFTLENPRLSLMERRELLDWEIRPLLRTVAGVADVNVLGGYARTYQITPRSAYMAKLGITLDELIAAVRDNNLNMGAGKLEQGNDALIVRTEGRPGDMRELANLVVAVRDGASYRLADLADVGEGYLTRYGSVTRNMEETTEGLVIALKDSNTGEVVAGVKRKLSEIEATLPAGTEINVFYDRSNLIDTAVNTISNALLQAVILVILLLAVFLGNLRAALVVSLSLPLAALATFFFMELYGLSANLMSLGGLVIAIGMIVDSSVVVVENIATHLAGTRGLPPLHRVFRASKDVAVPVVSGTLIVIIVFSPLLTLTGLEGKLFKPVALTIVFAMLSALAISLTVIPSLASLLLDAKSARVPGYVVALQTMYRSSLARVMEAPLPLIVALSVALPLSVAIFLLTGKTFMPTLDEGDVIVQLEKSPSISLQASTELTKQVEAALFEQIPEIRQIVSRTGSDELGLDPMTLNETDIFMELQPASEWRAADKLALIDSMRSVLLQFPGINFNFTQPIQMRVSEMLTGSTGDIAIKVFGNNVATLARLTDEISGIARGLEGTVDVQSAVLEGGQFLNISLKPAIARRYGMSVADFAVYVKSRLEGVRISELIEGKKRIPIVVASIGDDDAAPASVSNLRSQMILMPDGSLAPLAEVADIDLKYGPLLIERERGNRFGVVTTNVVGRDIVGVVEELDRNIQSQVELPTGYYVDYGGEFENQQRAMRNLTMVVPVALVLIMVILFTTFQSMRKALLILGNIPFALVGGVIALFISGEYVSVPASVGFIALLGVSVLNGVVMLSHFEQTRDLVGDLKARVQGGAVDRLRPILMTATTAMFGLFPLVFASGPGAEIQKPLAIVVIGGLISSTLTTLYVLPLGYLYLERRLS